MFTKRCYFLLLLLGLLWLRARNQSQHCIFTPNTKKLYHCLGKLPCVSFHFASLSHLRICLPLAKVDRKRANHLVLLATCPPSFLLSLFHPRVNLSSALMQKMSRMRKILLCSALPVSLTVLTRLALFSFTGEDWHMLIP